MIKQLKDSTNFLDIIEPYVWSFTVLFVQFITLYFLNKK
jgi:hypothetical protein